MKVDVSIDPGQFIRIVQPLLEAGDAAALQQMLRSRWNNGQILELMELGDADAAKVAALALALVGGRCCIDALAKQLHHSDPMVNQMAEHALWSIWFRLGTPEANHHLCRGTQALSRRDFDCACCHFSKAAQIDPTFAEAYNQRAIAAYLQENYESSITDCFETTRRMPCHFGAWAGMGHCQAHLGDVKSAIKSYERALEINPRLECVGEALAALRRCRQ